MALEHTCGHLVLVLGRRADAAAVGTNTINQVIPKLGRPELSEAASEAAAGRVVRVDHGVNGKGRQ